MEFFAHPILFYLTGKTKKDNTEILYVYKIK